MGLLGSLREHSSEMMEMKKMVTLGMGLGKNFIGMPRYRHPCHVLPGSQYPLRLAWNWNKASNIRNLSQSPSGGTTGFDVELFENMPPERIRNFSIIAHVDHGKSTLADRLLEITSNSKVKQAQMLDSLAVERERGITVKSSTAAMIYRPRPEEYEKIGKEPYLINMVDTPGHVDFQYEVQRAMGSCQGALLLVDTTQGVQAQTISNFRIAKKIGLSIIPCLTKLDLQHSDPARSIEQIKSAFGYEEDEILWSSAKTGEGVLDIFPAIIQRVRPPAKSFMLSRTTTTTTSTGDENNSNVSRALLVDSWHDKYQGVVCLVNVQNGFLQQGMDIAISSAPGKVFKIQEVGVLTPRPIKISRLRVGQIGYMLSHIKETKDARVGEGICEVNHFHPIPSFPEANEDMSPTQARSKAKIFASVYPSDAEDFSILRRSMERLTLNDASVSMQHESSGALGQGFRCGFLGMLHMEVFFQRLKDDFETEAITTAPTVPYRAILKTGETIQVEKASDLPDPIKVVEYQEPMVKATVVVPQEYLGTAIKIFTDRRATQLECRTTESDVIVVYLLPWQEAVSDLFDVLKSSTSGYASVDFEDAPYRAADVVRVDILVNGDAIEPLSFITHRTVAETRGRTVVLKLKEEIPRQQYDVILQAAIGARIIAREKIGSMRKDVLTKSGKTVGGGDVSRKRKLLEKQKEGKKRLKTVGSIQLSQKAFHAVLSK